MKIIEKYVTVLSYREKVEKRIYDSGRTHWYIFQGNRWYITEGALMERYIKGGTIIPDTGREDYIQHKIKHELNF